MKNYKFLVPILLVAMFVGSVFMLMDVKATELKNYNDALALARNFREKDIQIDAEEQYMQALNHKPSLELYLEIGQFYLENGRMRDATNWGYQITTLYPEDVQGYEFLIDIYKQQEDYVACYDLYDVYIKRGLHSEGLEEAIQAIKYEFYFNGGFHGVGLFSEGLCLVESNGKWGYVNQAGERAIAAQYSYAGPFSEGLAPVTDTDGNSYFIDTNGNKKHVVLNVENVQKLGTMENGVFPLFDGEHWNFYNTTHEMLFGGFDDVTALANGVVAVKSNGSWTLVDHAGNDLTGKTYANVAMDEKLIVYRNDRLFVSDGTKYQMITSSGEVVGSDTYEDVHVFNDGTYAAVKINGKWGFIDKNGEIIITPQFEDARSFANGLAAVMVNSQWGFIDLQGEIVIDPQFEDAREFNSDGCAFVLTDGEWKLLRLYMTNH